MQSNNADFIPSGAIERRAVSMLRLAVRALVKPALSPNMPLSLQRWSLRQVARVRWLANSVKIQRDVCGGVEGEWARRRRSSPGKSGAAILYLHGGGYCLGSPATHRSVTTYLARAANLPVFAAAYRLAPEHPFPAAIDDAVAAYGALAAHGPVAIAGDSAGGGLAMATAFVLRQRGMTPPSALVLLSPWVDLTLKALPDKAGPGELMLSPAWLEACARHYLAGADAASPLASPLFGDLHGLPPTLIQAGGDELLCGEAVRLRDALLKAGVVVTCEIVPGRWHAFQVHAGMLPSANAALRRAGSFIARNLG